MKNFTALILLFPAFLVGCVRSNVPAQCPEDFSVSLFVQDKNYTADATPVDENLLFADYISGVYYVMHNTETGEDISSGGYIPVTGSQQQYPISLSNVPAGQYLLTAWGNLSGMGAIVNGSASLHPSGEESTDIYLGYKLLDLRPGHEQAYTVGMQRTKGLLEIECVDFPASISRVDVSFEPVYATALNSGSYSGSVISGKSFLFGGSNPSLLKILLAPTLTGTTSNLTVSLYETGNSSPIFIFPTNGLTIVRNEITMVRLNYNVPDGSLELWVMIDGQWVKINYMAIQ